MEIERKFLVDRIPEGLAGPEGVTIDQGYLAIDERSEVRLRRAGDALTLTVKNGHGQSRRETEVTVDQPTFDDLWPESEGRRVGKVRRKVDLGQGLVAELDVYGGELEGVTVVEVEFESEAAAGEFLPPAWFDRELTGDKAWANQSLATAGRPERQLEFRLRPGEEAAAGVCRVIAARAAQASAAVRRASEAEDPATDVHQARKSLKKVRSAVRLLRGVIPDDERKEVNRTCREAAGRLSGARDAEVKLDTLDGVAGKGGAGDWRSDLEGEAAGHRDDLTGDLLAEIASVIESVRVRFVGRSPESAREEIAGNTGRGYRRGRKAMKKAGGSGDPVDFHSWRKRAKDLRYQLEILEPRLPADFTERRKNAEGLADLLGDLHDLDVLAEDLEGREMDSGHRRRLAELIAERRDRLAEQCLKLGRETYDLKPKRLTNRVGESLSGEA